MVSNLESSWLGFKGVIDEVGVFNAALPEGDIKGIMNNGLSGMTVISPSGKLAATWGEIKG